MLALKGNYDQAITDYTQAIKLKPDDTEAYYNRGNAYDSKGNHDQAITDYTQAIKLKPDLAEAYYNRGITYKAKKDKLRAIADFRKCVELNKNPNAIKQLEELGAKP